MRGIVVVSLLALGIGTGAARAAEVGEHVTCDRYAECAFRVVFRAAPGERNQVSVAETTGSVSIVDSGASLVSRSRACLLVDAHRARCSTVPAGETISWVGRVEVHTGDLDDRLDASGMTSIPVMLDAGGGADVLIGGMAADTLLGGGGSDDLDGGPGVDVASYADHERGVRADLAAGAGVSPGERDRLTDVEDLQGGPGDDVLLGDDGANGLAGGSGDDVLRGRGGDDILGGEAGADVLDGGAGDDELAAVTDHTRGWFVEEEGSGPDRYVCGPGADHAETSGARPVIGADCETLQLDNEISGTALALDRCDPARDAIRFPLDFPGAPFRLTATLSHRRRVLGRVVRRVVHDFDKGHAVLRFSRAGARYVERHHHLEVRMTLTQRQPPPDGRRYRESVVLQVVSCSPPDPAKLEP